MNLPDLLFELTEASERAGIERVMLKMADRFTTIKCAYIDDGIVFIESED